MIDRCSCRHGDDENDAAIVYSTVDLGDRLGPRATAEGVETEATWGSSPSAARIRPRATS